jgi:BASS family bile acid:Na+ symporter
MDVRDIIDVGIPVVVIFLMTLVGVRVTLDDFRRVLERPRLVGAALVAQPLLLPLLAGGMGWLAGVTPLARVALILIAACPAGVLSNVYTVVAGGNVALSVTLTAAGTATSVVVIPLVTMLGFALVQGHDGGGVSVPLSRTVTDLVFTILVPVGLGMLARPLLRRRPRLERTLQGAGLLATLALVGVLLVTQWETVTGGLARLTLAVVAFSAAALLAGDGLGRAMPTTLGDRVALALELPGRNLGVAAVVGVHSLGRPEIAALATAVLVVQVPLMFAASLAMRSVSSRRAAAPVFTR